MTEWGEKSILAKIVINDFSEDGFTAIPKEDYWVGLYMKGISDLTKEEAENEYFVPLDIWEERVRIKNKSKGE
ncbi:hypothetical protein [Histophilus somni]|uniref:Uncharacterized protein n=2 Tax=Histophilus somni TaxID=731 RepID=A0AAX2S1S4_HISSO|nr:hypothetical protein [Histophilus somni]TDF36118.1 hypothetical protein E1290_08935 [Histophilus somni]TEW26232.1 hypothetical protein E2R48_10460 [Histophilus somni]TFF00588.1 hypothetical protein E3U35_10540 [Histophilus somni]THA20687.1 hypothetical protein E5361_09855 [Histophilus somni]THA87659.1 hypothetical protein E6A58_11035 [Histophilus somni]